MPSARPHQQLTEKWLPEVLATAVLDADFTTRVISDEAEAEGSGFTSSPTVLIDDRDPFAEPDAQPSPSRRICRTPAGPAGAPPLDQLRPALEAAAGGPTDS
ncbi:hypothetical protein [Streptomyces sp. 1268]|uniref:hypothetical protein n=1 Tax=Streptomyces sp. 1268 TaxID=3231942 RepID=UPI0038D3C825